MFSGGGKQRAPPIRGSLTGARLQHSAEGYSSGYSSNESSAKKSREGGGAGRGQATDGTGASIPLTGDARADADIMAFLKARQNILAKTQHR